VNATEDANRGGKECEDIAELKRAHQAGQAGWIGPMTATPLASPTAEITIASTTTMSGPGIRKQPITAREDKTGQSNSESSIRGQTADVDHFGGRSLSLMLNPSRLSS
jgi:hypothetical protein